MTHPNNQRVAEKCKKIQAVSNTARTADFIGQVKGVMMNKGLTVEDIAQRLSMDVCVLKAWLSGMITPTLVAMYALADAVEMSLIIELREPE